MATPLKILDRHNYFRTSNYRRYILEDIAVNTNTFEDLFLSQADIGRAADVHPGYVMRHAAQHGVKPVKVGGRFMFYRADGEKLVQLIKDNLVRRPHMPKEVAP